MSVVLQLDGAALNALFPEGSEARLELRAAVSNQILAKLGHKEYMRCVDDLSAAFKGQIRAEAAAQSAEYFKQTYNSATPTEQTKRLIRVQLDTALGEYVRTEVARQIEENRVQQYIRDTVHAQVNRLIDAQVKEQVEARLKAVLGK